MKTVGLILLFILLMALFGWASSGVRSVPGTFDTREWSALGLDQLDLQDIMAAADKAAGSDIFPEETAIVQQGAGIIELGAALNRSTEFPEIGGVSIIDGTPHVLLWLKDEGPKYFSVSEEVDENWSIRQLNMQEVIAFSRKDEQEFSFFITGSHLIVDSDN